MLSIVRSTDQNNHRLNKSRSQRIVWLLQECHDLDWSVKVYKRQSNMLAPPTLKEIHPLGKSPVISVEAAALPKPLVLAESGAIVEYLCDYFAPHLVPARYREGKQGQVGGETEAWLRYRFYMHYAEGSLMTLLMLALFVDRKFWSGPARLTCSCFAALLTPAFVARDRNKKQPRAFLHQTRYTRHREPR